MTRPILTAWQRLVNLLSLDKKDILQVGYYAIFAGIVNLSLPLGIQAIINLIQGAQISTSWVVLVILVTLGVAFAGALQFMQLRIIENLQQKIFTRASFEFVYRFPKIKMSELRNYYPPELANRFFDTLTIQKGVAKLLLDFPAALLQIILGLLLLSFYHSFFIFYGILLIALIYILFKYTAPKGLQTSLAESKSKYKVAHWIQEIARTVISFKSSGNTSHALDKNDALVSNYIDARESHFKILAFQFLQLIGFKVLVTAGLLLIGGVLVLEQKMNIGQFVAAEIIILLIISSVEKLILSLEAFYDVLTSLEKLGQVVDKELESQQGEMPFSKHGEITVELKEITYSIPETSRKIIHNLSLTIPPHSRILLQGENGSGKSTLLQLIAGLIVPHSGSIYINHSNLLGIPLNHYRAHIGQVLSEESPFEGTLLDNLTFGDTAISPEEIQWALEKSGLQTFVKEQPLGLHTMLYPEGRQLPYTISRKILLARSILRKPKLLLLKEPLYQFEEAEAERIMDFLAHPSQPWSLVVASQDPRWAARCQTILRLKDGALLSPET